METKKRRAFTAEYKADVVELVRTSGKPVTRLAQDLGLPASSIFAWVRQAGTKTDPAGSSSLSVDEKVELAQLRRDNRELKMERDFLKKTAGFFARECK